ncbi:hypothetical protein EPN28_01415 [Patescibacteria group bacterium]|nr:MAG: hypothetical protein EPN28_01415 [Patescibacteria group bacterium]
MKTTDVFREKLRLRPNPFITSFMVNKMEEAQSENEKLAEAVAAEEKVNADLRAAIAEAEKLNEKLEEQERLLRAGEQQIESDLNQNIEWLSKFKEITKERSKRIAELEVELAGLRGKKV